MNLGLILPIAWPLTAALVLLAVEAWRPRWQLAVACMAHAVGLVSVLWLLLTLEPGAYWAMTLGHWPAPWGIELRADGLSLLMLLLSTVVIGLSDWQGGLQGATRAGSHYHALMQFQLMGLNGAFLTADLFNLFVFFEVLLLASYGLLLYGGRGPQLRPGLHYVVLNLLGSALFLLGASLVFGATGSLNMADVAARLGELTPMASVLARSGLALLTLVFVFKAAVGPLGFWLPWVYAAAPTEVVAVFALMTKVGIYALLRLQQSVMAPSGVSWHAVAPTLLYGLGLAGMLLSAVLMLGAQRWIDFVSALVLTSSATLLCLLALPSEAPIELAAFYLLQSTLVVAALLLLLEPIRQMRPEHGDRLEAGEPLSPAWRLLIALGLLAVSGLPPFLGFVAKLNLLLQTRPLSAATALWWMLFITSAVTLVRSADIWLKLGARGLPETPRSQVPGLATAGMLAALCLLLAALASPVQHFVRLIGPAALASQRGNPVSEALNHSTGPSDPQAQVLVQRFFQPLKMRP